MRAIVILSIVLAGLGIAGRADAYPQFQLSRDPTCSGCHISPAGGNLLNENGLLVAESISKFGTSPEFFYNKIPRPDWLTLGGDLRFASGYLQTPERVLATFPMQLEMYVHAAFGKISFHGHVGGRPPQLGNESATRILSREHYLMWQQKKGEGTGLFVRAGRFMPVFGLRFAEHPLYTRRYGGTQLYADSYGVSASLVEPKYEAHVSAFTVDPLLDPVDPRHGGAFYAEYRLVEKFSVGLEGMAELYKGNKKLRAGITTKVYIEPADLLIQGEMQFVNQLIEPIGAPLQLVGNLIVSRMIGDSILLDVGVGHFDENLRIREDQRDCLDVSVHWFTTSHLELVANTRYELIGLGEGGDAGAYAILQLHYRL
jgi:hypothetical protein